MVVKHAGRLPCRPEPFALNTSCLYHHRDSIDLQNELRYPTRAFHAHPAKGGVAFSQDAARMQRVVSFYEKLPRGAAPEIKGKGIWGRYQAKYFGKNPSGAPIVHVIIAVIAIGYAQNYYFHLRHHKNNAH
ncbi:hypothetical protein V502_08603 [Pseudogymnoascus sp. VKM F-4520 (FW-2644)]|nr:hypothetical protein V502_08603 [Pseudogymnoascus sp. VKM F-4520 (FW-2644)]